MLKQLVIRNIVLIEQLSVDFKAGLCVLTGETGAGKSILMDALMFSLGSRANQKLLRHGADRGSVTAEFDIAHYKEVQQWLGDVDLAGDNEVLLLRRVIDQQGRTKAYINDMPVSLQLLAQCGDLLVEVHGQHDQKNLLSNRFHRQWLDHYSNALEVKRSMQEAFDNYKEAQENFNNLQEKAESVTQEREYLQYAQEELNRWDITPGREKELSERRHQLQNSEKFIATIEEVQQVLLGNSLGNKLQESIGILLKNNHISDEFNKIAECVERADIELKEAEHSLALLGQNIEEKEESLEQIEEHLFALRTMARKYNVEVDGLLEYRGKVEQQLAELEDYQGSLSRLKEQLDTAKQQYREKALSLSEKRKSGARSLEQQLTQELVPLRMDKTTFQVKLTTLPEEEWSREGVDVVEFMVSTNPGAPLGPLSKIASGGELSRFMLALKVVLHQSKMVPTMIFDEVDTGIGGAVADAVGKRLYRLGEKAQLLIITHQPQVAAYGTHHYKVTKQQSAEHTMTHIAELTGDSKRDELARMLSGAEITGEARAAANKLLEVQSA